MIAEFDYDEYVRTFNTGDDEALIDRFFADDLEFSGGSRDYKGKDGLRQFLAWAHDGVREVIRLQSMCRTGNRLFVEVDMDFHASKVRDDFPFAKLRPGDSITVKFLVTYDLNDEGKVRRLQSMTWPAGKGVTSVPRLGGSATQLAAYGAYTAAFSAAEHERYSAFYTDDVTLELGSVPPISGKQGIVDFYTPMFARVREGLTVHKLLADDQAIFVDTTSTFTALEDAPDFVVGALKEGEYIKVRVFVFYTLRDGLISTIKVARAGMPETYAADGTRLR
jgi:predicted SnoaL-like aldol condensation-catalyzing enzyme